VDGQGAVAQRAGDYVLGRATFVLVTKTVAQQLDRIRVANKIVCNDATGRRLRAIQGRQDRRRRALDAIERREQCVAVAAIQMDVVARGVDDLETDRLADD